MYYYNQLDYSNEQYNKPDGTKTNLAIAGCGPAAACIAINNACGKELYTVTQLRDLAQSSGARISNGTDIDKLLRAICKAHPEFSFKATQLNKELLAHLKNGGMAIINQGDAYNVFSTAGHFVVAVQLFGTDVVDVYDPQLYDGKYSIAPRPSRIELATVYGARVKIDEVSKATQDRNPCYWLISYDKPKEPAHKVSYTVGRTYTLQTDLKIRTGAGTNYAQMKRSQLTADAQQNSLNETMAVLKKGTKVTVQEIKWIGEDAWLKIPSGWIAGYYDSNLYVKL